MSQKFPLKWAVGLAVVGMAGLALTNLQFGGNVVYFYTPPEALAQAAELSSKTIKVGGMVKAGSVQWEAENVSLNFVVSDLKQSEINVSYKGAPPDMFKEMSGVVVEGRIDSNGQNMTAQRLMVKHSEEYKKPDAQHSVDKELLEKSIFKE